MMDIKDRLKKGAPIKAPITVIYGQPGLGKTTLACDLIKKYGGVLLPCEDGLGSEHGDIPNFGLIESYDVLKQAIGYVAQNAATEKWHVLVIDGLDRMLGIMAAAVCERNGWKQLEDGDFGKGNKAMQAEFQDFLLKIIKLRNSINIMPVFVGHHQAIRIQPPDADPYIQYGLSVNDKLARMIVADCDILGFVTNPVSIVSSDQNFGKKINRARFRDAVIKTRHAGTHVAKWRGDVPDSIPMNADSFAEYVPFLTNLKKGPKK